MSWLLLEKCGWAALAAVGFATFYSAPIRTFWVTGLLAALGYLVRGLAVHFGADLIIATLMASCVMGLLAIQCAHWVHTPTTVFMAPAVIPMVPGVYAYRTVMGLFELTHHENASTQLLMQTMSNALVTIFILLTLAAGASLPSLLFRNRSVKEIRFLRLKKKCVFNETHKIWNSND